MKRHGGWRDNPRPKKSKKYAAGYRFEVRYIIEASDLTVQLREYLSTALPPGSFKMSDQGRHFLQQPVVWLKDEASLIVLRFADLGEVFRMYRLVPQNS